MKITQRKDILILHERADWSIASVVSIRLRAVHNIPHGLAVADAASLTGEKGFRENLQYMLKDFRYLIEIMPHAAVDSWCLPVAAQIATTMGLRTLIYRSEQPHQTDQEPHLTELRSLDELDTFANFVSMENEPRHVRSRSISGDSQVPDELERLLREKRETLRKFRL